MSGSCCCCRYEVQGEYVIPPNARIPESAASMAQLPPGASPLDIMHRSRQGSDAPPVLPQQPTGRWRVQVSSPGLGCRRSQEHVAVPD